jgi:hypothetical protein
MILYFRKKTRRNIGTTTIAMVNPRGIRPTIVMAIVVQMGGAACETEMKALHHVLAIVTRIKHPTWRETRKKLRKVVHCAE